MQSTPSIRTSSGAAAATTTRNDVASGMATDEVRSDATRLCRDTARAMLNAQATPTTSSSRRPNHRDHSGRLLLAVDRARRKIGLPALPAPQKDAIRTVAEEHARTLSKDPRRRSKLLERIKSETAKHKLSTAWVTSRIEKAAGAVYTTGDPGRRAMFNSTVIDKYGRPLKCDALSGLHLDETLKSVDGKVESETFSKKEKLTIRLTEKGAKRRYKSLRESSDHAYIFQAPRLGRFMARQLSEMRVGIRAGLLESTKHAMTLRLRKKNAEECDRPLVAGAFDSNITNKTRRTEQASPSGLKRLTLRDFVASDKFYPHYLGDGDETTIAFMHNADQPRGARRGPLDPIPCTIEGPLTSRVLAHVMEGNLALDMKWALKELKRLSPREIVAILDTRMPGRRSALQLAVQDGYGAAVKVYDQLLKFALSDPRCAKLIRPRIATWLDVSSGGNHAVLFTLLRGTKDMLQTYGDLVLDAHAAGHLTDVQLQGLLACHDSDGMSALYAATCHDNHGFVDTWLALLQRVPADLRWSLLDMTTDNGVHGTIEALRGNNAKLADKQLAVLRRAHQEGLITGYELISLSTTPELLKEWRDCTLPNAARNVLTAHLVYIGDIKHPKRLMGQAKTMSGSARTGASSD